MSVSSPLVSVVSTTGGRDVVGSWLSLSNTSLNSDNKTTHGEPQELRSTNWSLMDPGHDFSPPPPQNDKKTLVDVLWPEWEKTKGLRSTGLNQGKMSHKHGANEE